MRKVFLDDLPRKEGIGALKGKQVIDWKGSLYYKVRFIYDDIEGEVEIRDYDIKKNYLTIKYRDELYLIKSYEFKECKISRVLGKRTSAFKYEIRKLIKDKKRDLIIVDREYREFEHKPDRKGRVYIQNQKWYKYKCLRCGYEGWIVEGSLTKGIGCTCCCNRTAVLGVNTIWDTDRWMYDLGISEEDAKKYTPQSNKKIEVVCSDCGRKMKKVIYCVYKNKSIGCSCSDKVSYPEKFMISILNQLEIDFETQYSPEWIKPKRYDFYIPSLNMIIETHGIQHYEETRRNGARTLEEEHENDRLKKELALENSIKHYVIINSSKSELEWMKFNVCKQLNNYFDINKVNFGEAEEFALKNIAKEVCKYWKQKEDWETTQTIANDNNWGINNRTTIKRYLVNGTKHGWCNYDSKGELKKAASKIAGHNKRQVEVFKGEQSIGIFESVKELERQSEDLFGVRLIASGISAVCLRKYNGKTYKGFTFKYVENNE